MIIPAASGLQRMTQLSAAEHAGLIRAFSELNDKIDVFIIDTAAGISDSVTLFSRAAQENIVVVCNEPASITDAYALIKVLNRDHGQYRFRILANMIQHVQEGRELFEKLAKTTDQFLDVALDYLGIIPQDEFVKKAIQRQKAVVTAYPRSRAAVAFKNLAQKADNWPVPTTAAGHLEFFVERLIESGVNNGG
jgi:flagellar biosynthesis protein FlhG